MTHYPPAIAIAIRALLSLYFFSLIPLFEIKSNTLEQNNKSNTTSIGVHLYFEGLLSPDSIDIEFDSKPLNLRNKRFVDLWNSISQLKRIQSTDKVSEKIEKLINSVEFDLAVLNTIGGEKNIAKYIIDYAYLDRKSHYYSIKIDVIEFLVKENLISENELISCFNEVLKFLDNFYSSGYINSYRKNEQSKKYDLLAKMLDYLNSSSHSREHMSTVENIFKVSRKGEVFINRFALLKGESYSEIVSELLIQIESIEYGLYSARFLDPITYKNRNDLREKYLEVVQSLDWSGDSEIEISENTTLIAFLYSKDYIYQYIKNLGSNQLIKHDKRMVDTEVKKVINEMDQALLKFNGSIQSLDNMQDLLESVSDKLLNDIEYVLSENIRFMSDGQLTFFPFELLMKNESEYLFQSHNISYQFDFQRIEETILDKIYNVKGSFAGRLKLDGFDKYYETTLDQFKEVVPDNSLLHIGTHQVMNNGEPYILLSETDSIGRNEWFKISGIAGVLMSMCAGFRGQLISGEMSRSFGSRAYENGAENVITSLWSVDDFATSSMIEDYFENLENGASSDISLRQAKIDYLTDSDRFHKHPVFWAAFVHYGNTYRLKNGVNYLLSLLIIAVPFFFLRLKIRVRY